MKKSIGTYLKRVREKSPLVHNITNYVTVNDVANVVLAIGASPIMSDEPDDVSDITSICNGLNINIGTLNKRSIEAMYIAGKRANELGHVLLLDPVGAGASALRTNTALELVDKLQFDVIRGNISEIKTIATGSGTTKGVDADSADIVTKDNLMQMVDFAKKLAKDLNVIIAITGAIDLIANGDKCYAIYNGNSAMSKITGTGCQLSALITAFVSSITADLAGEQNNCINDYDMQNNDVTNSDMKNNDISNFKLEATVAAVCTMGLAGEIAFDRLSKEDGNSTYRNKIIDAIYNMTGDMLEKGAKYECY